MVEVTSLLIKTGSGVGGVRAWKEMEIRCVKGIDRLKLVSSGKISKFSRSPLWVIEEH